jgi:putative DNA primase/helicase
MDIVGRWIEERCVLDPNEKDTIAALHADYKAWARSEIGFEMSAIVFGPNLSERGLEKVKVGQARGIRGLKLVDPGQQMLPM